MSECCGSNCWPINYSIANNRTNRLVCGSLIIILKKHCAWIGYSAWIGCFKCISPVPRIVSSYILFIMQLHTYVTVFRKTDWLAIALLPFMWSEDAAVQI